MDEDAAAAAASSPAPLSLSPEPEAATAGAPVAGRLQSPPRRTAGGARVSVGGEGREGQSTPILPWRWSGRCLQLRSRFSPFHPNSPHVQALIDDAAEESDDAVSV